MAESGSSAATGPVGSGAAVNISFLAHWGPDTITAFKKVTDAYHALHSNVTIDVRAVPFGDLLTTIQSQASSPSGPTIMNIYDLWLPQLVQDGVVGKMPDAGKADLDANWGNLAKDVTVEDASYGYPNEVTLYALNYNKKLFSEAGIASPPKTWDELEADAKKLTKRNGSQITQQGFGLISSWAAGVVHPFASLLNSNGGSLITDGKSTLDSPQAKETFELIDRLANADKVSSTAMSTADANTAGPYMDSFISGRTAMIIMANWWQSSLKKGMGADFANIATAPIPVGPSGDGSHPVSYSWLTTVNARATADQQVAAWDFLKYLNSPDSGTAGVSAMSALLLGMGSLPSRTSDIAANQSAMAADRFLKTYSDAVANVKPFPIALGGQEFTESLQKHLEALQAGRGNAADTQAAAQKDGQSILDLAAQ